MAIAIAARDRRDALRAARSTAPAIGVALAALLVIPAIYSATVWQVPVNGTFPVAGPYIQDDLDVYGIPPDDVDSYRTLLAYVRPREPASRWDVLTQGSNTAAVLDPARRPRGGARRLRHDRPGARARRRSRALVARGEVRYVALGGGYASRGGNAASAAVARGLPRRAAAALAKPAQLRHRRASRLSATRTAAGTSCSTTARGATHELAPLQ